MNDVIFSEICIWDNSKSYHAECIALINDSTLPDALIKAKSHGIDFLDKPYQSKLSLEVTY